MIIQCLEYCKETELWDICAQVFLHIFWSDLSRSSLIVCQSHNTTPFSSDMHSHLKRPDCNSWFLFLPTVMKPFLHTVTLIFNNYTNLPKTKAFFLGHTNFSAKTRKISATPRWGSYHRLPSMLFKQKSQSHLWLLLFLNSQDINHQLIFKLPLVETLPDLNHSW